MKSLKPSRVIRRVVVVCLSVSLLCGALQHARCQSVDVGGAIFGAVTDQVPADWYVPMLVGETRVYEGYGENAGAVRTETYSRGESVGGVRCIKWHVAVRVAGALSDVTEDWWLAVDDAGDLRVLKRQGAALPLFDAFVSRVAPVFMPGSPATQLTWELFGRTLTITSVAESAHAGVLQVRSEAPGSPVRTETYEAGTGLVSCITNGQLPLEGSGWRRITTGEGSK